MEIAIPWHLDTPLGTLDFVSDGDGLRIFEVAGMDGAQIRATVEPRPQDDGARVFDAWRGARYPVLSGVIKTTDGPYTLRLDGTQSWLRAFDSAPYSRPDNAVFTWAGWVKPAALTSGSVLWSKGNNGLRIAASGGFLRFLLQATGAVIHEWTATTLPLTANTWQHVACTFDTATGTAAIYVNGQPCVLSKTTGAAWTPGTLLGTTSASVVGMGREATASSGWFNGSYAGPILFYYSRALTASEIHRLYESNVYPTTGLGLHYELDEGSGTAAVNEVIPGTSDITLMGAPVPAWDRTGELMMQVRRQLEDKLRAYTNSLMRADGTLRFTPSGAAERQVTVRLLDPISIANAGVLKEWQLALVAGDPYTYSTALHSSDSATLTPSVGTWGFPHGFPFGFGSEGAGGTVAIANAGTAEAHPIIQIYGPANGPAVYNLTTSEFVALPGLALADGDYAEIDTINETVALNGSPLNSLLGYVDLAQSVFFGLEPGENIIQLLGGTAGSVAKVTVIWRDAYV